MGRRARTSSRSGSNACTVTAQLAEEGVPKEDLKPLLDLEARVRQMSVPAHSETVSNRRKRRPPSEVLLARASALIDLLIKGGSDEAEAAQMMMRKLVAAGIPPRCPRVEASPRMAHRSWPRARRRKCPARVPGLHAQAQSDPRAGACAARAGRAPLGPKTEIALARNAVDPLIVAAASEPASARARSASAGCARSWRSSWPHCR